MNISNRLLAIEQSLGQSVIPLIGSLTEAQPASEIGTATADALTQLANYHQVLLESIRSIRAEVQIAESQTAAHVALSNALLGGAK